MVPDASAGSLVKVASMLLVSWLSHNNGEFEGSFFFGFLPQEIMFLEKRLKAATRQTDEASRSIWRMWDVGVTDRLFGFPMDTVG